MLADFQFGFFAQLRGTACRNVDSQCILTLARTRATVTNADYLNRSHETRREESGTLADVPEMLFSFVGILDPHVAYDIESFEFALGFSAMVHEALSHEPPRNYIRKRGKCWPISSSVFSLNLEEPRVGTSILNVFSRSLEHEQL